MNIIVIVTDSLRVDHLGCYGSDVQTPNIDKLAADLETKLNAFAQTIAES